MSPVTVMVTGVLFAKTASLTPYNTRSGGPGAGIIER